MEKVRSIKTNKNYRRKQIRIQLIDEWIYLHNLEKLKNKKISLLR